MTMDQLTTRGKLTAIIGVLLIAGFLTVNIANYRISSQSVRDALINNELPLTSNNIYSEIQASLLRPIYISSLMANDTFLKDWMLDGEQDLSKVTKYLDEIRLRYSVSSTFVVSARTHHYYYYDGILKTISPNVPKDSWFFSMKDYPKNYRVDVDYNEAKQNTLTIFVNHKLYDYDGRFLGVTGLGLDVVSVAELIARYRSEFERTIYFVDHEGMIKSHHDESLVDHLSIRNKEGISSVADRLLSGDSGFIIYSRNGDNILLSYRFIPELNWYLLVEQAESDALHPIRQALYVNLAIGALVTLIILLISNYTLKLFHGRLEEMAKTDKLTGLINRQYFDAIYSHAIRRQERDSSPLSLAMFDVDNLKDINDRYGHLEGDRILVEVANVASHHIRGSDVISRWGGDEFTILFSACDEKSALHLVDNIRMHVEQEVRLSDEHMKVGISAGVAQFRAGDDAEMLLSRADKQLYAAKHQGRQRA